MEDGDVFQGFENSETVQQGHILRFFQTPHSDRLGRFGMLFACKHCGHLAFSEKDGEFFHVMVAESCLACDPWNRDHCSFAFHLSKKCDIARKKYHCDCNNPEPLDYENALIDYFYISKEEGTNDTSECDVIS